MGKRGGCRFFTMIYLSAKQNIQFNLFFLTLNRVSKYELEYVNFTYLGFDFWPITDITQYIKDRSKIKALANKKKDVKYLQDLNKDFLLIKGFILCMI